MGVQDRDWYWKDRDEKQRKIAQHERDPRTTEYHPKEFRGSHQKTKQQNTTGTHWIVKVVWWIVAAMTLRLAYLFVITL